MPVYLSAAGRSFPTSAITALSLIGHLPAGYLATAPLLGRSTPPERRRLLVLGLAASARPDLALFYFYFMAALEELRWAPTWTRNSREAIASS